MKAYSYYLFDADGTLLDTTELIFQCFVFTCRKYGDKEISRELVVNNIGLTLRRQTELYLGLLSDERYAIISGDHMRYQLSIYPKYLRLFPDVLDTLNVLRGREKRCAVVTSRRKATLELYLKETGVCNCFETCITPETTSKHKPDPEPALAALSFFGVPNRADALMVGDSEFDIECGARAGIDTALVRRSHNQHLIDATKATYVLDDLKELCL